MRFAMLAQEIANNGVGTLAQWLTLGVTAIAALGGVILAIKTVIPTHKLVNQRFTDIVNYQRALIRALEDRGIDVPIDQSVPVLKDPK